MPRAASFAPSRYGIAVLSLAVVLTFLLPVCALAQQPIPINRLAYSAKFLCLNAANGDGSLPANMGENTVVEVHNPHTVPITVSVKLVQDYPSQQILVPPYNVALPPNGALNLDCNTLLGGLSCPPLCGNFFRGFVEISSTYQVKVVALYKETMAFPGALRSVTVAKKSSPGFIIGGVVRHSGTFFVGDAVTASKDTLRQETTISIANMSNSPVNANILIVSKTGVVTSFPKTLTPNGFTAVTGADLPPATPRPFVGGVTVQYADTGFGILLECEEIIQNYIIAGPANGAMSMSVVEVQPIPIR